MKILKETKYKAGYIRRVELINGQEFGSPDFEMVSFYNLEGHYIGDKRSVKYLIKKRGIYPELRTPTSKVCSIGFSKKDGKWYGWSHRAIYGFKKGDIIKKGHCGSESLGVGFKAKSLDDCKKMAIAFAESVS